MHARKGEAREATATWTETTGSCNSSRRLSGTALHRACSTPRTRFGCSLARRQLTNLSEPVRHDVERLTCRFVGVSEHEEKLTVARNIVVAAVEAIQFVAPLEQHSLGSMREPGTRVCRDDDQFVTRTVKELLAGRRPKRLDPTTGRDRSNPV